MRVQYGPDGRCGRPVSWRRSGTVSPAEVPRCARPIRSTGGAFSQTGLAPYKRGSAQFTAQGDAFGLLRVMKRGRVLDFTGNEANGARVYPTTVNVRGAKAATHQLAAYPYTIAIEERCSCA